MRAELAIYVSREELDGRLTKAIDAAVDSGIAVDVLDVGKIEGEVAQDAALELASRLGEATFVNMSDDLLGYGFRVAVSVEPVTVEVAA